MRFLSPFPFFFCADEKETNDELENEQTEPSEEVENTAPNCEITLPAGDLCDSETVIEATVSDAEDASSSAGNSRSSDKDGEVSPPTVRKRSVRLSRTVDQQPVVTLRSPIRGRGMHRQRAPRVASPTVTLYSDRGRSVSLNTGVSQWFVSDAQDAASDLSLSWESSLDGAFTTEQAASDGSFELSTLIWWLEPIQ